MVVLTNSLASIYFKADELFRSKHWSDVKQVYKYRILKFNVTLDMSHGLVKKVYKLQMQINQQEKDHKLQLAFLLTRMLTG